MHNELLKIEIVILYLANSKLIDRKWTKRDFDWKHGNIKYFKASMVIIVI